MAYDAETYPADVEVALGRLGAVVGTGDPSFSMAETIQELGSDYICAVSDGSVMAWGEERIFTAPNGAITHVRTVYRYEMPSSSWE
jgi:hypothetical protein